LSDYVITKGEPVLYHDQKTMMELLEKAGFKSDKIVL